MGYGGYGTWDRGSRVLRWDAAAGAAATWVRMENGSVIDAGPMMMVNST